VAFDRPKPALDPRFLTKAELIEEHTQLKKTLQSLKTQRDDAALKRRDFGARSKVLKVLTKILAIRIWIELKLLHLNFFADFNFD
jgi:hypothetical protein